MEALHRRRPAAGPTEPLKFVYPHCGARKLCFCGRRIFVESKMRAEKGER